MTLRRFGLALSCVLASSCCLGHHHEIGVLDDGTYLVGEGALAGAILSVEVPSTGHASTLTIEYALPDGTAARVTYEIVATELD